MRRACEWGWRYGHHTRPHLIQDVGRTNMCSREHSQGDPQTHVLLYTEEPRDCRQLGLPTGRLVWNEGSLRPFLSSLRQMFHCIVHFSTSTLPSNPASFSHTTSTVALLAHSLYLYIPFPLCSNIFSGFWSCLQSDFFSLSGPRALVLYALEES